MVFGLAILSVFTRDSVSRGYFTAVFMRKSLNRVEKRVWKHRSSKALVSSVSRAVLAPVKKVPRGYGTHRVSRKDLSQGGCRRRVYFVEEL